MLQNRFRVLLELLEKRLFGLVDSRRCPYALYFRDTSCTFRHCRVTASNNRLHLHLCISAQDSALFFEVHRVFGRPSLLTKACSVLLMNRYPKMLHSSILHVRFSRHRLNPIKTVPRQWHTWLNSLPSLRPVSLSLRLVFLRLHVLRFPSFATLYATRRASRPPEYTHSCLPHHVSECTIDTTH